MMDVDMIANIGTVNTPYVVAGAYEERPELMNQTPFYKMRLDCLVMPEEELVIKEFYGTLEQIDDLLSEIEKDEWWAEYYASTLDAWDKYRAGDHDAEHFVGNRVEYLLTPVTEICRSGYLLDKVTWGYRDKFGCIMLADAELLDVKEYLLQDGFQLVRVLLHGSSTLNVSGFANMGDIACVPSVVLSVYANSLTALPIGLPGLDELFWMEESKSTFRLGAVLLLIP